MTYSVPPAFASTADPDRSLETRPVPRRVAGPRKGCPRAATGSFHHGGTGSGAEGNYGGLPPLEREA